MPSLIKGVGTQDNMPNGSIAQETLPITDNHENGGSPFSPGNHDTLSREIDDLLDGFGSSEDELSETDDGDAGSSSSSSSSSSGTDSESDEDTDTADATTATWSETTRPTSMSRFASVGTHPMDGIAVENSAVGARSMSEAADVEEITGSADEDENVINEPMEEEEGVGEEQNPVSQEKQTSANEDDNMMQHDCQQIQGSISIANTLFGRTAYDATDSFVSSIMLHILENQSLDQDSYERIEKETSVVDDMEDHNDDDSMITDNDMQEVKYEEEDLYQIVAEEEQNQEAEIESIKLEKSSASSTPDLTRELTSSTLEGMESTPEYSLSYEDANDETTSYTWEASDEGNNSSTGDNFY